MSSYKNNATDTPVDAIGTLPEPLYWWEAGAVWGGMIDYTTVSHLLVERLSHLDIH